MLSVRAAATPVRETPSGIHDSFEAVLQEVSRGSEA
jgi:hypothetical protein